MLILIPILLLILFAVTIHYLGRYKLSIGSTWLITAGAVVLIWVIFIVFRILMPEGVSINNWSPFEIGSDLLIFQLSEETWIFAFLLVSLLLGVVFTDPVRLGQGNNLTTWTGSLVLTAVGLLSIYSQTFLAVIITWSIIDIVEFGILIRVIDHQKVHLAAVIEFTSRIIGTLLIMAALIFSNSHGSIVDIPEYSKTVYLLIFLGATLRLGVFPLHVSLTANLPVRRSLGTLLRYVAPISVLSLLTQIEPQTQHSNMVNLFSLLLVFTALYGASKWVSVKNELIGRTYWILAFSCLALLKFLNGQIDGMIALSMILILCGGYVFFHSFATKFTAWLSVFCFIGLMGFPFTPGAPIWVGDVGSTPGLIRLLYLIAIMLLFMGFFKHILRQRDQEPLKELWMQLFYSTGLLLLAVVPWVFLIWRFKIVQKLCQLEGSDYLFIVNRSFFILEKKNDP